MLSHVQFFVTSRTVNHQAALSMGFLSKNTRAGCHFLLQRIFLAQESNPCLLHFLHWQVYSLPLAPLYCFMCVPFYCVILHTIYINKTINLHSPANLRKRMLPVTFLSNTSPCLASWPQSFSSVQSLSRVRFFETPWIAACQASLSITNSQSLLKLISINLEAVPGPKVRDCKGGWA